MKCQDKRYGPDKDLECRFQTKGGNSNFKLAKVTFLVYNTTSPYDALDGPDKDFRLKGDNSKTETA